MPDRPPTLRFKTRGIYLSKEGSRLLPLESANVKEAEITAEQVYENNVIHYMRQRKGESSSQTEDLPRGGERNPQLEDLARKVVTKKIACAAARNEVKVTNLDLRELLGANAYGVFFITATGGKEEPTGDSQLVLITDIGLTVKKSESEMLVWVNTLSTAQPIAGANVSVYTRSNQKLLDGVTDANGVARFKGVKWAEDRAPFAVLAAKSGMFLPHRQAGQPALRLAGLPAYEAKTLRRLLWT